MTDATASAQGVSLLFRGSSFIHMCDSG